jgi:hypothetical protein
MILYKFEIGVTASRDFGGPPGIFALNFPLHFPIAGFEFFPEVRSSRWNNEIPLPPARGGQVRIFEPTVPHEFCVQPAIARVIDLFEKDPVEMRRNKGSLLL